MIEEKQKHLKQKISLKKRMWLGFFGVLVFLLPLHTTYAIHEVIVEPTREGICSDDTPFSDLVGELKGRLTGAIPVNPLAVPVNDLVGNILLADIGSSGGAIVGNTAIIQSCLEMLVFKETITDVELQHQWRNIIGTFVKDTVLWVQQAYDGNPIYLNSQYIYYRAVDDNLFLTFLREIAVSNIGETAKKQALIALLQQKFTNIFPYTLNAAAKQLAPDGVAESLASASTYTASGGFVAQINLQSGGGNIIDVASLVLAEYQKRRGERQVFEQEKLAWGRGFFSYEICDLDIVVNIDPVTGILSSDPNDRRNCRIATPGSLIQDQVSFVLGSALRQMELADEAGEWVSGNAGLVLRNVLGEYGLDTFPYGAGIYPEENDVAVSPAIFDAIYKNNDQNTGARIKAYRAEFEGDFNGDGIPDGTLYPREFKLFDLGADFNLGDVEKAAKDIAESGGVEDPIQYIPSLN